ncbi:MAG: ABC transporter permease [Deltaproteobacteria bacterium]|nr:ABC transporter permease [Deltaproteobacteria bacterium]
MKQYLLPVYSLWLREIVRFLRQRKRVVSALGQPLIFWALLGFGFQSTFVYPNQQASISYLKYFFPGIIALVVLFTAIFSSFSLIEDKNEGYLQGVFVSPITRLGLVLGKVLGGATLATFQACLFLILAPLVGFSLTLLSVLLFIVLSFLISILLTAFGYCLAWKMDSSQGFHAVMMLILMPLWFLSGAFFPQTNLPWLLKVVMTLNPMTYVVAIIRRVLHWKEMYLLVDTPSLALSFLVILVFLGVTSYLAWRQTNRSFG